MNLDSLERLAREATPEPYFSRDYFLTILNNSSNPTQRERDAKFMSLANPDTVLELISALKTARDCLDKISDDYCIDCECRNQKMTCASCDANEALATLSSVCGKEDGK